MVLLDQILLPVGVRTRLNEPSGDAAQGRPSLQVPGEHLPDDRRLVLFHPQTRRITWPFGIGAVAKGHPQPGQELSERSFASRPRRILSAMRVLSYSATAPLICNKSWSLGSWLMGLSTNSTRQPRRCNSSRNST